MSNNSIWSIDKTLSDANTLGQSGSGSDGNEGVLYIPQSSSITGASPSDCLGGGARGVVVIAVGNEHGDTSSNPGRDWLHFT